jgi:hypothetical protein
MSSANKIYSIEKLDIANLKRILGSIRGACDPYKNTADDFSVGKHTQVGMVRE